MRTSDASFVIEFGLFVVVCCCCGSPSPLFFVAFDVSLQPRARFFTTSKTQNGYHSFRILVFVFPQSFLSLFSLFSLLPSSCLELISSCFVAQRLELLPAPNSVFPMLFISPFASYLTCIVCLLGFTHRFFVCSSVSYFIFWFALLILFFPCYFISFFYCNTYSNFTCCLCSTVVRICN